MTLDYTYRESRPLSTAGRIRLAALAQARLTAAWLERPWKITHRQYVKAAGYLARVQTIWFRSADNTLGIPVRHPALFPARA